MRFREVNDFPQDPVQCVVVGGEKKNYHVLNIVLGF